MSRIIVKNLPKNITEEKIRQIFGEKGSLTDIQLKYTASGKFRQFAFIGYQNESDAQAAIGYFHNTCIQTSKLTVQLCAALGDSSKPRSWSKYSQDSSVNQKKDLKEKVNKIDARTLAKKETKEKAKELLKKYNEDSMFREFMEIHNVKDLGIEAVTKSEENLHEQEKDSGVSEPENELEEKEQKVVDEKMTDIEYLKMLKQNTNRKPRQKMEKKVKEKVDLFTLKLRNLPYKCKKSDIKQFFRPLIPFSIRIPRNVKGIAYIGFKNEKQFNKALLKDKSIIMGKSIQVIKYTSDKHDNDAEISNQKNVKWITQEEKLKNEEDIGESGRIFIRNLSYTTIEDDIHNLFSKFGPIAEVNMPIDSITRKLKGFGVVTYLLPEHAVKAYAELDGSILHGRMLHLLPGLAKESENSLLDDESTNYKQKKAKQQKAQAGLSHNWNSLFLGHDAVAGVIASSHGISKKDVLDPHGKSNAAVRLALGETEIVTSTRKYLEQEGVVLDAFNGVTVKRSKTIILVKNLPANTTMKELYDIFQVHGVIGRVILPPSGITALVEFIEPSEAKKAFTRLAYSKFKNLPLYLEWAPENSLLCKKEIKNNDDNIENKVTVEQIESKSNNNVDSVTNSKETDTKDDEEVPEDDTTLFVKNLNFETIDENLKKHFESCGKIHYATVATKKDNNNPTKRLSMGYGFVRFMYKSGADKALKTLQQSTLDGKSLELKRSERTLINDVRSTRKVSKKTKQTGTKILVRNVPFQAKLKEIQELFTAFGEIKALRLPKKMSSESNSHRGFAFVDFVTSSDAKNAFEALSQSTHLYGRRLVLEWASTDEDVENIRKRTASHFHTTEEVRSKKSVLTIE